VTTRVGADIQEIDEVRESLVAFGDRYLRRIYTDVEIAECGGGTPGAARALAGRFAAKEAVFKVLGEFDVVPTWKEIEVRRLTTGHATVTLRGSAAELAARQGIGTISLSISQSGGIATAVVVAESSLGSSER